MPATNQQVSTISAKLIGPVAWRKVVLFIDPLIRLAVTCNSLIRGSALALFGSRGSGSRCAADGSRHGGRADLGPVRRLLILTVMGPDATVIAGMQTVCGDDQVDNGSPARFLMVVRVFRTRS
jgi:hypothetical protein